MTTPVKRTSTKLWLLLKKKTVWKNMSIYVKVFRVMFIFDRFLTLYAPTTQNGQKQTNCLSVFDHFVGLALKGLNIRL